VLAGSSVKKLDAYSLAHLTEAKALIDRTLTAQSIYNVDKISSGGGLPMFFFQPQPEE
jgi:hypothetical protein